MKKAYDYLIVGAGLFGATFAHLAGRMGKRCLVLDRRRQAGGNIYCERREGIDVHKYGAHIFHTSNDKVWNYVNELVEFNRYTNSPVANYRGTLYNLPFNMNTFNRLWGVTTPAEAEVKLAEQRSEVLKQLAGRQPANLEEQALSLVGHDIYNILIKDYTEKQWGRKCSELPAFIINRLPVRMIFDNNYFNDRHQGIPVRGYNELIDTMLNGCDVRLGVDFFGNREVWESLADKVVFTGKIDEFYDYRYGNLEYRSVSFEEEVVPTANYQGVAVMNYTDSLTPYTRVIEHKHFAVMGDDVYANPVTVISREYSSEWKPGDEPFYPVNDKRNSELYARYRALADAEKNIIFGGRLAEYRYYDMAPTIERAMEAAEKEFFNKI